MVTLFLTVPKQLHNAIQSKTIFFERWLVDTYSISVRWDVFAFDDDIGHFCRYEDIKVLQNWHNRKSFIFEHLI